MRKTILTLALATSTLAAAACSAQGTPQTAAQANNAVAAQIQDDAAPPPPMQQMRGHRGMRMRGMMRADTNHDGIITRAEAMAAGRHALCPDGCQRRWQGHAGRPADASAKHATIAWPRATRRPRQVGGGWVAGDRERRRRHDPSRRPNSAPSQRFDRMDTNHDGKLDKDRTRERVMEMRQANAAADRQARRWTAGRHAPARRRQRPVTGIRPGGSNSARPFPAMEPVMLQHRRYGRSCRICCSSTTSVRSANHSRTISASRAFA